MSGILNTELLTFKIEQILAAKYGKTVTVRLEDAKGIREENGTAGRSKADKAYEGIRPKGSCEG